MAFDAIMRLAVALARLGVSKFKITGGEPTLRSDLVEIIASLKKIPGVANVTLTTNGLLLNTLASPLAEAGLDSVNISLDSLDSDTYRSLSGAALLDQAISGLRAAHASSIPSIKINCVPQGLTQPLDLLNLAVLARDQAIHVRFIELMPIGPGALLPPTPSNGSILKLFEDNLGPLTPTYLSSTNGPATYYRVEGFKGLIGFISAIGACFCADCNRIRITSDGILKTCLHMDKGHPLPLGDELGLQQAILLAVSQKPKSHLFNHLDVLADTRAMNRIGG
jgi:cyclic pyranopterin phosphate synthase